MQSPNKKSIFAISGSLRSGSSNHNILRFLEKISPPEGVSFFIYDSLAEIPPFDPGNDHEAPPEPVSEFRDYINHADALIICTPEYAYGVPGQLKNALDWTVSSGSFTGKPTALITASTGGENAHEALIKILGAIDANVTENTRLLISFVRSKMDGEGNVSDNSTADSLKAVYNALLQMIA